MKTGLFAIIATLVFLSCATPAKKNTAPDLYQLIMQPGASYDSTMAARLGGNDNGMKAYVMAFLKKGPNRSQDSLTAVQLQKAHLENINRMAEAGKLVIAGPFIDNWEVRGIYIFDVPTVEEARELTETDPAIQAGRLVMELHPWYGPAALPLLLPLHKRLEKKNVAD